MLLSVGKCQRNDLSGLKADEQLCLQCIPLLLSRIVSLLLFGGRSAGGSAASTRTTSYSMSLFSGAFQPGTKRFRPGSAYLHPFDPSVDIAFRYSVSGRYMGISTIFPQIFQGSSNKSSMPSFGVLPRRRCFSA